MSTVATLTLRTVFCSSMCMSAQGPRARSGASSDGGGPPARRIGAGSDASRPAASATAAVKDLGVGRAMVLSLTAKPVDEGQRDEVGGGGVGAGVRRWRGLPQVVCVAGVRIGVGGGAGAGGGLLVDAGVRLGDRDARLIAELVGEGQLPAAQQERSA